MSPELPPASPARARAAQLAWPTAAAIALLAIVAAPAAAQEAMYTEAATMPSPHTYVLRQQFHYFKFGNDPESDAKSFEQVEAMTSLSYGLARDWALTFSVPLEYRRDQLKAGGTDSDKGVSDLEASVKWRLYKQDSSALDTLRIAVIAGAEFASGDDHDFSSQSINPHIGGVLTIVRGRHGFDQDLHFQFNTGDDDDHNTGGEGSADALRHNTAYLYRLYPEAFTATATGAWYATAEINGIYETNGDYGLRFSPGLMYEGRRWALEFMGQLPLYEDLNHRPELDFAVGVGLRFSF